MHLCNILVTVTQISTHYENPRSLRRKSSHRELLNRPQYNGIGQKKIVFLVLWYLNILTDDTFEWAIVIG